MKKNTPSSKSVDIAKETRRKLKVDATAHNSLIIEKLPGYFLLACLLVAFAYMVYILSPFLTVIFVAAVLTITFYPLYEWVLKFMPNWRRISSLITCFIVVLLTIAPLTFFSLLLTSEATDAYEVVRSNVESGTFDNYLLWEDGGAIYDVLKKVDSVVDLREINLKDSIVNWAQDLSGFLASQVTYLVAGISSLLMNFFIMVFSMFYFFKDGKKLVEKAGIISPLPSVYEEELFKKVKDMVKAIMVGVFLTAIVQGLVGGIGFAIVGISSPVFWAAAMAILSLVPLVGTAVVWLPAALVLLIMGLYGKALFILIWGVFFIGSVDNLLRPYLIGGKARTYPLLTFFVILGGIFTMGFKGIIVGPLVLMVLMSFLHIYEAEYYKVLKR